MKFQTILADPAWTFTRWGKSNGARSEHYLRMTLDDICALPVQNVADKHCTLYLWTTPPHLTESIQVGEAWGFSYRTIAFTWAKLLKKYAGQFAFSFANPKVWHMGMGYWTRHNAELVLLFTQGKPHRLSADVPELVIEAVGPHSRKPEEVQNRIERLTPGPYLELFARRERPGWVCLGNEVTGNYLRSDLLDLEYAQTNFNLSG